MDILKNLPPEMAPDYIEFLNSFKDLPKRGKVSYGRTSFDYVLLDDIMSKAKENSNFGVFFSVETLDVNLKNLQVIFVHKSGVVLESRSNLIDLSPYKTIQEKGAQLTYEKRYLIASYLGISADPDTDGMDKRAELEAPLPKREPKQEQKQQVVVVTPPSQPKHNQTATPPSQQKQVEQAKVASSSKPTKLGEEFKKAIVQVSSKYNKPLGEFSRVRLMEIADDSSNEKEETKAAAKFLLEYIEKLENQKSMTYKQEELGDLDLEQLEEVTKSSLETSVVQKSAKLLLKFYNN